MKKILFITHTISGGGGAEKVLNTLIDELSSEYKIDILEWLQDSISPFENKYENVKYLGSITYSDRKAIELGQNIIINKIKHFGIAMINMFFPKCLYKKYIHGKYDFEISFNYLYTSALIANSPNSLSKKIMWMHGAIDDLNEINNSIKYKMYKWMQHKAFNKADAIVAISNRTHNSIIKFQSEISNRIHDIYNGYDLNKIELLSKEIYIEKSDKFRLISLGRLDKNKNNILQIDAIEKLRIKGFEVELYILGEGDLERELRQHAQNNKKINFLGFKSNPYPYIESADALIITSLSEGFPTIAVEAMALGKPVISTPVAGTEELIIKDTGIIVNWNVEDVASGIKNLMSSSYDSDTIKQHVSQYTKERWAENVKNLFNSLENEK